MYSSIAEVKEICEMRKNIRRTVALLDVCWSCECVGECVDHVVDDGAPVWLCGRCRARLQNEGIRISPPLAH